MKMYFVFVHIDVIVGHFSNMSMDTIILIIVFDETFLPGNSLYSVYMPIHFGIP